MRWRDDDGIATPVEMMYLLVFCMVAVLFIGYLGRLHTAGVQVTNAAQAAARAASLAPNPSAGAAAAAASVDTRALRLRCQGGASTRVSWVPSPTGSWQGGSVTVVVTCVVRNSSLAGVWVPGQRSVIVSDTQPVDRYHR
jgi:Flp pilus assembly protein TadG